MKSWFIILTCVLFFCSCNSSSTTETPDKSDTDSTKTVLTPTPKEEKKTYTIVRVNNLRVRSSPDQNDSEVIGMLKENMLVKLTGHATERTDKISLRGQEYNEHWYEIETFCITGWVYGGALDRNVELTEVPKLDVRKQITFPKNTDLIVPPPTSSDSKETEKPLFTVARQQYFNELSRAFFNINTDKEFEAFWSNLQAAKDTFIDLIHHEDEQITKEIRTQLDCALPYFSIECGIECLDAIGTLNIAYLNTVVQELAGTELDEIMNIANKILGDVEDDYYLGETFESSETRGGASYASSNLGNEQTLEVLQQLKKLTQNNPNSQIIKYLVVKLITHIKDAGYFSSSKQEVLAAIAQLKEISSLLKTTETLTADLETVRTKLNTVSEKKFNSNVEDQSYD